MKPRAGDFIIAAFVALLAAAIWLVPLLSGQGSVAIVSHDGKTVANIPLSETHRIEVGGCVIRSDGGSIYVESADCPDSVREDGAHLKAGRVGHMCSEQSQHKNIRRERI